MGRRKRSFFIVSFLWFSNSFAKNLMKKPPIFKTDIKSSHKLLLSCKDLRSINFWQRNEDHLKFLGNLYGNAFLLFIFINWKNYWNFLSTDSYKMPCWHLLYWKLRLCKMAILKLWAIEMLFQFLKFFTFSCFCSTFVESFMKKLLLFNANFWKSIEDIIFCQVLWSQTSYY